MLYVIARGKYSVSMAVSFFEMFVFVEMDRPF